MILETKETLQGRDYSDRKWQAHLRSLQLVMSASSQQTGEQKREKEEGHLLSAGCWGAWDARHYPPGTLCVDAPPMSDPGACA